MTDFSSQDLVNNNLVMVHVFMLEGFLENIIMPIEGMVIVLFITELKWYLEVRWIIKWVVLRFRHYALIVY